MIVHFVMMPNKNQSKRNGFQGYIYIFYCFLLEVKLPYDPVCPSVDRSARMSKFQVSLFTVSPGP